MKRRKKNRSISRPGGRSPQSEAVAGEGERKEESWKDWLFLFLAALALAVFIRLFVGGTTSVEGESMHPSLENGDILVVNKIPCYRHHYQRGDIVILDPPVAQEGKKRERYVKRIIGLPHETVRIRDGKVYVDHYRLDEFYIEDLPTLTYREDSWELGDDQYFVLGDNREVGASNDSRLFGLVDGDRIKGVVTFRIWPFSRFGDL